MNRKKIIKLTAGIFAAVSVMMTFTGCNGNTESSIAEESPIVTEAVTEKNETVKKEYSVTQLCEGRSFDNIKSLQTCGENIYVYEQKSGVVEKEIARVIDASSGEVSDLDLSAVDYMYIQYMANDSESVCVTYCDNEGVQKMCSADIGSGKINADISLPDDTSLYALRSDDEGNFTALDKVYGDDFQHTVFSVYDSKTLEKISETDITPVLSSPASESVIDAILFPDALYVFSVDYRQDYTTVPYLYKIDLNGTQGEPMDYVTIEFEERKGNFIDIYKSESGNLCAVSTDDYAEYYVYEFKNPDENKPDVHTVKLPKNGNFIGTFQYPGYDFTCITSSGVTGYKFADNKCEVVLSFGKELDTGLKDVFTVSSSGNTVCMYSVANAESGRAVTSVSRDGNVNFSTELTAGQGYASAFCTASDGYIIYSETYDPGVVKETASGFNTAYIFHILDEKGNPKSSFKVDSINDYGDAVIQDICSDSQNNICMLFQEFTGGSVSTVLYVTDRGGKVLNTIKSTEQGLLMSDLVVSGDDVYAVCSDSEGETVAVKVDVSSGKLSEPKSLQLSDSAVVISGSGKSDIYYTDENKIFGYSFDTDSSEEMIDFSAVPGMYDIIETYVFNDTSILCSEYNSETGQTGVICVEEKK
ncbi:MAG: hypothetical protein PUB89_03220 [Oscillospiraceae bacterium]|nr:hypothetical protein [Oscillospiraceae bacterium]